MIPGASGILTGLRVVEISAYVATPLAGMTLAQLGADVIRVEPIGGQVDRSRAPLSDEGVSLYWTGLNKGKRALEVDFREEKGRQLVADLIVGGGEQGGIVVTNTDRFPELRYAALRGRRSDVIHVNLKGRHDGSTAVDYTVQARAGLHAITGPAGHVGPVNDVLPFWDVGAGLHLAIGVLAAERRRRITGLGSQVELALEDVALTTLGSLGYLAEAQLGRTRPRDGNYVSGMFGRDFASADGERVMIVVLTHRHWRELTELTGTTSVFAALEAELGIGFEDEHVRHRHRELIAAVLAGWFAARRISQILRELAGTSVLHAAFQGLPELVAGEEFVKNPLFAAIDQPGVPHHLAAGSPLVVDHNPRPAHPAPQVGQHTMEILRESDFDETTIAGLLARGIIGEGVAR